MKNSDYNEQFLISITQDLELKEDNEDNANTLQDVLDAFNSYPIIEKSRGTVKTKEKFSFQPVPDDLIREIILNLDGSKATSVRDLPSDMLKFTVDEQISFINFSFERGCFPDELKLG